MSPRQPASSVSTPPLVLALDQNDAIKDVVKHSADELLVINAVLKQQIPDHAQTGDIAQALQQTDELESRIQESADELAQVNQLLEQEIHERADLERELVRTKTALAQAKSRRPQN